MHARKESTTEAIDRWTMIRLIKADVQHHVLSVLGRKHSPASLVFAPPMIHLYAVGHDKNNLFIQAWNLLFVSLLKIFQILLSNRHFLYFIKNIDRNMNI